MFTLPGEDSPDWDEPTFVTRNLTPRVSWREDGDRYLILDAAGEPIDSTRVKERIKGLMKHWQHELYGDGERWPGED
jgi:hypothetical protein